MPSREEIANGMRAMADFIENDFVPMPNMLTVFPDIGAWHSLSKDELATIARLAARAGLNVEKNYYGNNFSLKVGTEGFKLATHVNRELVCRKVDTGKTETYKAYDDSVPMVEKERPVYEWICDEPLLGGGDK